MAFVPGHAFRDGKLYAFTQNTISVIRAWGPRAGAWIFTSTVPAWRGDHPRFRIATSERRCRDVDRKAESATAYEQIAARCHGQFLQTIPSAARDLIRTFPDNNWPLIQLVNRFGGAAEDLIASTPALAYLLADSRRYVRRLRRAETVRSLLRQRQRDIAVAIGLPAQGAVRILRKVPLRDVTRKLHFLRRSTDVKAWKALMHLSQINASSLRIATDPELFASISFGLLEQISHTICPDAPYQIREALRLADVLGEPRPYFRALEDVEAFHAVAVRMLNRNWRGENVNCLLFPSPPHPGDSFVQPIRTPQELRTEGAAMHHCVVSYAFEIAAGQRYVYSVSTRKGRATLAVRKSSFGWEFEALSGPHNLEVDPHTRAAAWQWLDRAFGSVERGTHYEEAVDRWVRDGWIADSECRWRDFERLERTGEADLD